MSPYGASSCSAARSTRRRRRRAGFRRARRLPADVRRPRRWPGGRERHGCCHEEILCFGREAGAAGGRARRPAGWSGRALQGEPEPRARRCLRAGRARRLSRPHGSGRRRNRCAAGPLPPAVARRAAGSGPRCSRGSAASVTHSGVRPRPTRPARAQPPQLLPAAQDPGVRSHQPPKGPAGKWPGVGLVFATPTSGAAGGVAFPAKSRDGAAVAASRGGRQRPRFGFPGRACEARAIVGSTRRNGVERRPSRHAASFLTEEGLHGPAPNTSPSSSELLASRLAPCAPVHATSPAAYSPGTEVRPRRSVDTPPIQ